MERASYLLTKLTGGEALVGVIGLGYVGLPLAVEFAGAGLRVLGFDTDPQKVDLIQRGESYITDVPATKVASLVTSGVFTATSDMGRLGEPDALCICVPTPLSASR